jgi:Meckel syndrome type 1 protein
MVAWGIGPVSEKVMTIRRSVIVIASIAAFVASADVAFAAASATTKECSDRWAKLNADNKVPKDLKWPQFLSQCAKELAASSGDQGAASAQPAPTKTVAAKSPTKSKSDAVDESESGSSAADKKACDTKWGAYKTSQGVHGWKAYFTFMAGCMP